MARAPLGDQELEVLSYVGARAPISARDVADGFGVERGLARTTVLTVLERLRGKGYLHRRRRKGIYLYSPASSTAEVVQGLVRDFVEKTLGGSVSPLMAYLVQNRKLTDGEVQELEQLVEDLKHRPEEPEA